MLRVLRKFKFPISSLKLAIPLLGSFTFIVFLGVIIIWVPKWQTSVNIASLEKRIEIENSVRQTIIQALGGLFFLVTAGLTMKNIKLTEDKNISDRFNKALEMIADERIEVRIGGIYSLERIAKNSRTDHSVIMEVLTAFLRERTTKEDYRKLDKIPTEDVQSALDVISRRLSKNDQKELNLAHADLEGAFLYNADLKGAFFYQTNLRRATLNQANLQHAIFIKTDLQEAFLIEADLRNAYLEESDLTGANMTGVNILGANIVKTFFPESLPVRLTNKPKLVDGNNDLPINTQDNENDTSKLEEL